jgi:hypothetical protein
MRRFWKRRREDEIERLLRANRAEPRDVFVDSVLGGLETQRPRFRPRRILVAAAVTALAGGAASAAGGAHVAGTSISSLVRAAQAGVTGANHTANGRSAHHDNGVQSAGEHQYSVEICHRTHSATNRWVALFLPPPAAGAHLKNHSGDYVVGASGSPSTCPP